MGRLADLGIRVTAVPAAAAWKVSHRRFHNINSKCDDFSGAHTGEMEYSTIFLASAPTHPLGTRRRILKHNLHARGPAVLASQRGEVECREMFEMGRCLLGMQGVNQIYMKSSRDIAQCVLGKSMVYIIIVELAH